MLSEARGWFEYKDGKHVALLLIESTAVMRGVGWEWPNVNFDDSLCSIRSIQGQYRHTFSWATCFLYEWQSAVALNSEPAPKTTRESSDVNDDGTYFTQWTSRRPLPKSWPS